MFSQEDNCNSLELETKKYQIGHANAINDLQKKFNLRSRDVVINKGRIPPNQLSSSQQNVEKQKEKIVSKILENKKEMSKENKKHIPIESDRTVSSFSLQIEIFKINISIPFNELLKNNEYRENITRMIRSD